ncbi:glycosyltransferase family 2 protein [Fulvivirga ligni]|uniref:glycosyltransferase family 2 protein n=1 Tax=Fulvivirga ligni TaxID=2904246 RepID=UPI001F3DD752|nr:glycosyltransferase family 2 protein [Fulvivirga ligni]UII22667.1 glycosyltransferase [Fulvivirga ligni]
MTNLLFSIITASHNSAEHIREAINSVLQQEYQNWELLVTDDGSDDETVQIIKEYTKDDSRIKIFEMLHNSGPAIARNNSISKAKGQLIAFLDSDDTWESDKLKMQYEFFLKHPECPLLFSSYNVMDSAGALLKRQEVPSKVTYKELLKNCPIGCLTAVINTDVTGKVYMPDLKKRQDYALWLKILKEHKFALSLDKPLANYRLGNATVSSNKFKVIKYQWLTYYKVENLNFFQSIYYMVHWALHGVNKHYLN